jgi:hypothetical protein
MTNMPEELRAWAKGSLPMGAATEQLLRAYSGRFAEPGWPWVKIDAEMAWIDFDAIPEALGGLSSGEQRCLRIAASLGGNDVRISLGDELSLDRTLMELVLAAVAHASGTHQDSVMVERTGGIVGFERQGSLYPWPEPPKALRMIDGGKK